MPCPRAPPRPLIFQRADVSCSPLLVGRWVDPANIPLDYATGLPLYYFFGSYRQNTREGKPWPSTPASMVAFMTETAAVMFAYTGSREPVDTIALPMARSVLDGGLAGPSLFNSDIGLYTTSTHARAAGVRSCCTHCPVATGTACTTWLHERVAADRVLRALRSGRYISILFVLIYACGSSPLYCALARW